MTTTVETSSEAPTPPVMDAVPAGRGDEELRTDLLARQAARIIDLTDQIRTRQEEIDAIKRQILESHQPGTYPAGGLKVQVKAGGRRLDTKAFTAVYRPAEHPDLYELKPKSLNSVEKLVGTLNLNGMIRQGASTVVVS